MFNRLQTRLTVLYTALFGLVLAVLAVAVYGAVSNQSKRLAADALTATGAVFDQVWDLRAQRLQGGAALLSRDFGFREALATHDQPTVASALANLKARLGVDQAFLVTPEGAWEAGDAGGGDPLVQAVGRSLADSNDARGVVALGSTASEVVSAPIMAPDLKGFVVFAIRLDHAQMVSFARLSAVPLDVRIVSQVGSTWRPADMSPSDQRLSAFVVKSVGDNQHRPGVLRGVDGLSLALAKPLPGPEGAPDAALLIEAPLDAALAPYQTLLIVIGLIGFAGLALVVIGSAMLSKGLTRPLSMLTDAARRLQGGEAAEVDLSRKDEVGDLARGFDAMAQAVAERERRITQAALSDAETRLPNRVSLEKSVVALSEAGAPGVFVAAFGVERFARMRGAIGYELAADVLKALGARLMRRRPDWALARTSADILSVAFRAPGLEAATALVADMQAELQSAQQVGDHLIDVRIACGLSTGAEARELIREADLALDDARGEDRRLVLFDAAAHARAAESLRLMPELRRAIEADALTLVHQPKWDVRRQAVAGVESLVRWTHPRHGPLSPDLFIGPAEQTGEIRALTDWVVSRALTEQAELAAGGHALAFSINLSGRLVGDAAFTRQLLDRLAGSVAPVCLEITETAMMDDFAAAARAIAGFAEAGIAVSIDDYGSGLSSLAYLKRIAASELKLDRSLVCDVAASSRDALLVRSTVELAHALGMKVVAEGVEDDISLSLLAGMGCDMIQGWRIAKPMPLAALTTFLEPAAAEEPLVAWKAKSS